MFGFLDKIKIRKSPSQIEEELRKKMDKVGEDTDRKTMANIAKLFALVCAIMAVLYMYSFLHKLGII